MRSAVSTASIIGTQGRRVFILVEDPHEASQRFAFTLNGEPVKASHLSVHRHGIVRGLNLVSNGEFVEPDLPWRVASGATATVGRVVSGQWALANGGTGYLAARPHTTARVEYVGSDGAAHVPVVPGERYSFRGYFGRHRCHASVEIELLSSDGAVITSLCESIPQMRGGQTLSDYAKVEAEFAIPALCAFARIYLSIDRNVDSGGGAEADAYLFFTHLSFSMIGEGGTSWRPERLEAATIAALSRGSAILDVTLPRFPSPQSSKPLTIEVIDITTGTTARNSPVTVQPGPDMSFRATAFDGTALAGDISGFSGPAQIELTVDGAVALQTRLDAGATESSQHIHLRIPDEFLDGGPHVVELRDAVAGTTLFINAVTLKSLVTPWEAVDDLGRHPLPAELHPMARRRYRNLVAHLNALDGAVSGQTTRQLGQCHEILSRPPEAGDSKMLHLPQPEDPLVSVVVCTSDVKAVYRAAAGIILAYNALRCEVIIATDDDPESVDTVRPLLAGAHFIASSRRQGRASLANQAVRQARGEFVVFLDAAAEPAAHWIDELHKTFQLFDNVAIAGGKLVEPSGRLSEAGGILWSSGSRQAVGTHGNAEHPQVNYVRQTDYVSSRALMIRKDVWNAVGGFSEDLSDPGFEDVDLALKVRAEGFKVVYVPHAVITLASPTGSAAPTRSAATTIKRRWSNRLLKRPPETTSIRSAMDYGIRDRILFVDQQLPRIDVDAGSYAAIQEMRLFQALGYKVTFLPLNLAYSETYTRSLERIGVEVIRAPFAISAEEVIRERGNEFGLVYMTRYHVARAVMPYVRKFNPDARIIFNNADLHFLRELRSALALNDPELLRRSKLTRDHELEVMRQADLTLSYNEVEHAVIQSHNLDETRVAKAPWVVTPTDSVAPFSQRADFGFLGSFGHRPNVDAVNFFAANVMPLLLERNPNLRLLVYGSQIGPDITSRASDQIVIKGHVANLADAFDTMRLFIAPLTAGAGIKGKVLSAMAHGVPCILSPTAAEGMNIQHGVHYLRAQTPDEWAEAIMSHYNDEHRWKSISQNALEYVRNFHSFEHGVKTMRAALEMINIYPADEHEALCCRLAMPPLT